MLKIVKRVSLKRATNAEHGNVQVFLERLLVEVISENYRYFLNEILLQEPNASEPEVDCWPPLLANERQVSGIFAVGMAQVCPVSRPEYAITRSARRIEGSSDATVKSRGGRVDFLANYGKRDIALELKRSAISSIGDAGEKQGLLSQWKSVKTQSKEALAHMRSEGDAYTNPVSIGLLVVRVSRKVPSRRETETVRASAEASMPALISAITKLTSADFVAHYVPPKEMQTIIGWGAEEDEYRVFPGVVFAAVVHGSTR